jgi:hypothetical protein
MWYYNLQVTLVFVKKIMKNENKKYLKKLITISVLPRTYLCETFNLFFYADPDSFFSIKNAAVLFTSSYISKVELARLPVYSRGGGK